MVVFSCQTARCLALKLSLLKSYIRMIFESKLYHVRASHSSMMVFFALECEVRKLFSLSGTNNQCHCTILINIHQYPPLTIIWLVSVCHPNIREKSHEVLQHHVWRLPVFQGYPGYPASSKTRSELAWFWGGRIGMADGLSHSNPIIYSVS